MKIYDENDQLIAHLDAAGVAHGHGVRVTVTLTVQRDDVIVDYDLSVCANGFCPECFFPSLHASAFTRPRVGDTQNALR